MCFSFDDPSRIHDRRFNIIGVWMHKYTNYNKYCRRYIKGLNSEFKLLRTTYLSE